MAYCTLPDIKEQIPEAELVQLTDDDALSEIDTSVIDRSIADADAEIDSYCAERYAVPFDPVPLLVRKYSVIIVIYNLFMRRGDIPDDRETNYNNAIKFLLNLTKGLVSIGADAPDEESQDTVGVTTNRSDRIFSLGRSSDNSTGTMDNY
jgi:phage gp36-like protein